MHYFIDGYNLLFRLLHAETNLQAQRAHIIYDLNQKISLIRLDVSIVFDAAFQSGEGSRSHFDALEILFTAAGETADEFIIDELKSSDQPHLETVVTSDKHLAWRARRRSAQTMSVEEFLPWLNRCYKNKKKQSSQKITPTKSLPRIEIPPPPPVANGSTDYYERIFEKRFQELSLKEEQLKEAKRLKSTSSKPRKKKISIPEHPEVKAKNEIERWLQLFEQRLNQEDI